MEDRLTHQAVVFADVCGSTNLYEALGDKRAFDCIALCLDILRRAVQDHGGRVVKTIGDEVMCVFPDASAAARAACEMQRRIGMQEPVGGKRLANAGQIMTTREIVDRLPSDLLTMTRSRDSLSLKGKREEIAIYELLSGGFEEVTAIVSRPAE